MSTRGRRRQTAGIKKKAFYGVLGAAALTGIFALVKRVGSKIE